MEKRTEAIIREIQHDVYLRWKPYLMDVETFDEEAEAIQWALKRSDEQMKKKMQPQLDKLKNKKVENVNEYYHARYEEDLYAEIRKAIESGVIPAASEEDMRLWNGN